MVATACSRRARLALRIRAAATRAACATPACARRHARAAALAACSASRHAWRAFARRAVSAPGAPTAARSPRSGAALCMRPLKSPPAARRRRLAAVAPQRAQRTPAGGGHMPDSASGDSSAAGGRLSPAGSQRALWTAVPRSPPLSGGAVGGALRCPSTPSPAGGRATCLRGPITRLPACPTVRWSGPRRTAAAPRQSRPSVPLPRRVTLSIASSVDCSMATPLTGRGSCSARAPPARGGRGRASRAVARQHQSRMQGDSAACGRQPTARPPRPPRQRTHRRACRTAPCKATRV